MEKYFGDDKYLHTLKTDKSIDTPATLSAGVLQGLPMYEELDLELIPYPTLESV